MTGEVTLIGLCCRSSLLPLCLASRVMFSRGLSRTFSFHFPFRNEFCTFKMVY
jgi:hypothetical protein